jgi:hypothetical protein
MAGGKLTCSKRAPSTSIEAITIKIASEPYFASLAGFTPPLNAARRIVKAPKGLLRAIVLFAGGFFARFHTIDLLGKFTSGAYEDRQLLSHLRYLRDIAAFNQAHLFFKPRGGDPHRLRPVERWLRR